MKVTLNINDHDLKKAIMHYAHQVGITKDQAATNIIDLALQLYEDEYFNSIAHEREYSSHINYVTEQEVWNTLLNSTRI